MAYSESTVKLVLPLLEKGVSPPPLPFITSEDIQEARSRIAAKESGKLEENQKTIDSLIQQINRPPQMYGRGPPGNLIVQPTPQSKSGLYGALIGLSVLGLVGGLIYLRRRR